jgi:2-polyprenyl-6-methoxyphenol hydroxylase-like FAD-dependent oxidoreductase
MVQAEHGVLIAGAGPTGMMLAAELALARVDVAIVERRASQELVGSRSGGLHARSIEVLDQRGVAERFVSEGTPVQVASFAGVTLDISDFPTRHPYGLGLWQNRFEQILREWIDELGVPVHREREVTGFTQDDMGVDVELARGGRMRADYLVGCDGGRSVIRKAAGIEFPGWDPTNSSIVAEVEMSEEPEVGFFRDHIGVHAMGKLEDGRIRLVVRESEIGRPDEPTVADLSRELVSIRGTDYGVHNAGSISRFTDMTRQAAAYRAGRVLLAGDAAHIHSPVGGQGLNTGIQDAVNLGWKLAQVVRGTSPEALLDSYHAERHPVAARVLHTNLAQNVFTPSNARVDALREILAEMLAVDELRLRFAGEMSGLDIQYDLGEGHPLLGRRMPDLDLTTAGGPLRTYALLHHVRHALVNFGGPGAIDIARRADGVQLVDAAYDGTWELPVVGEITPPAAVLIRPDGHVAWVGDGTEQGLAEALATWFGPGSAG